MHEAILYATSRSAVIHQISNDALYLSYPCDVPLQNIVQLGFSFGDFRNEYPDENIISFISFGPKSSAMQLRNTSGHLSSIVKARGFELKNVAAQHFISTFDFTQALQKSLQNEFFAIHLPQIRHKKNISKFSSRQVLLQFKFCNKIVSSRIVLKDGSTLPYGYA